MKKKIISSAIAALMIAGSTSFSAFAAMDNGTVVIGNKAYDLDYANDPANLAEISNAIIAGKSVYIKDFSGNWIENISNKQVDASIIPAVIYKSAIGVRNFDAADKDQVTILSVSVINALTVDNGTTADKLVLPATVAVRLSNNTTGNANITWDKTLFDGTKSGDVTIKGELTVPIGKNWALTEAQKVVSVKITINAIPENPNDGGATVDTTENDLNSATVLAAGSYTITKNTAIYGPLVGTTTVNGNVTVANSTGSSLTLKNLKISGTLTINYGDGNVVLDNVIVNGVNVSNVGSNSLHLRGNTVITSLTVNDANNDAHIVVEGNASVKGVVVNSGANIEVAATAYNAQPFVNVILSPKASTSKITLKGTFETVSVTTDAKVVMDATSEITNQIIATAPLELTVPSTATVAKVNIQPSSSLDVFKLSGNLNNVNVSSVAKLEIKAGNVQVSSDNNASVNIFAEAGSTVSVPTGSAIEITGTGTTSTRAKSPENAVNKVLIDNVSVDNKTITNLPIGTTVNSLLSKILVSDFASTKVITSAGSTASDTAVIDNTMKIVVTAEDGTENIYTINIAAPVSSNVVTFLDNNLEKAIRDIIQKPTGDILKVDVDKITTLSAQDKNITDLTGIENLTALTNLFLFENKITDLRPLRGLTSLQQIDLSRNATSENDMIHDISPLKGLTNLTSLCLYGNDFTNISALQGLTKLEYLLLGRDPSKVTKKITDFSFIYGLTSLVRLDLSGSDFKNIESLKTFSKLQILELLHNNITDISAISNFINLEFINLLDNKVSNLDGLKELTKLTGLDLRNNQIVNIDALNGLTNLAGLYLGGNQITNYTPVEQYYTNLIGKDFQLETPIVTTVSVDNEGMEENKTGYSAPVTVKDQNGNVMTSGFTLSYSVDKTSVVTVDENGILTSGAYSETDRTATLTVTVTPNNGGEAITGTATVNVFAKVDILKDYNAVIALVKQADYTAESWTTYQAIVEANPVTATDNQAQVTAATAAIKAAQKDLVKVSIVEAVVTTISVENEVMEENKTGYSAPVTVKDQNGNVMTSGYTLTYSIDKTSVVTVDANGILTSGAYSEADHTATLTVTSTPTNGGEAITGIATVNVSKANIAVVIKTALTDAIVAAGLNQATTIVSTDGKDIDPEANKWVTSEVKTAYTNAITAAQIVAHDSDASQTDVDTAVATLVTATDDFDSAKADGTRVAPIVSPAIELAGVPTTVITEKKVIEDVNGKVTEFTEAGKTPIVVSLSKGSEGYSNVRVVVEGLNDGVQLIAKDTDGNWYNIVKTGWGPSEGFALANATTDLYLIANKEGTYNATIKLVDVSNSNTVLATITKSVTAEKQTLVEEVEAAATAINAGQTLADSTLTGTFKDPDLNVPGTIEWNDPTTVVNATGSFAWTFTPTDTAKYNVIKGNVSVIVNSVAVVTTVSVDNEGMEENKTGYGAPVTVKDQNGNIMTDGFTLSYSVDKTSVVTVDENGILTSGAYSEAEHTATLTVTVTPNNGGAAITGTATVNVFAKVDILKDYNETLAAVKQADYTAESWTTYQAIVEANPVTATDNQAQVTAATAAIKAAQKDLVKTPVAEAVVTTISVENEVMEENKTGYSAPVTVKDQNGNVMTDGFTLSYSVDKTSVVTVDANGILTSGAYSEADHTATLTVTVTPNNGGKAITGTATVNVFAKVDILKDYNAVIALVKQADYTAESWTTYQAIVAANPVANTDDQDKVAAATLAIKEAQKDLVKVTVVEAVVTTVSVENEGMEENKTGYSAPVSVKDQNGNVMTDGFTLSYSVDKTSVVTVDANGILTSGAYSEAEHTATLTVTVTPNNGGAAITGTATVDVMKAQVLLPTDIVSIDLPFPMPVLNVLNGTALDDIGLPSTVILNLKDGTTSIASITFDGGSQTYDGSKAGNYVFTGTVVLPEGVTNNAGEKVEITVTVLQASASVISGTVKNPDGSLSDYGSVSMYSQNGGQSESANINKGKFIIGSLADGDYTIIAYTDGESEYTNSIERTITIIDGKVSATSDSNIELEFTDPMITGNVKKPDGTVATLGYVYISSQGYLLKSVYLNNGRFLIGALEDGVYNIFAKTYYNSEYTNSISTTITIEDGVPSETNIELEFTNPMITVTVKNPDGSLANSVYVSISSQTSGISRDESINDGSINNSKFLIGGLEDGVYNIVAMVGEDSQYTNSNTTTITIEDGACLESNLELKLTNPMITGTVKNPEGTLSDLGFVSISPKIGGKPIGISIKNGEFKIGGLADGEYSIVAITYYGDIKYTNSKTATFTIVDGVASKANIELAFTNPMITGTVKNPDGTMATSGSVNISSGNVGRIIRINNGKFIIGDLADGVYNIVAYTDGNSGYLNSKTRTITILDGVASDANIELAFINPMISGIVKNPDGTLTVEGYVTISSQTGTWITNIGIFNGKFSLGELADGVYNVVAHTNGDSQFVSSKTTTITILDGVASQANIELEFTNPIIIGTVKNPDETLAATGYIDISSKTSGIRSVSINNGKFLIGVLPDGVYNLVAHTFGNSQYANSMTRIITIINGKVSTSSDANIELDFTNPMITVTVKNPDGTLANSGNVTIYSQTSGMSIFGSINNSKFLIGGLADGVYNIVVYTDGDSQYTKSVTKTITIVNGVASDANIELEFTNPMITVTVKNPDGKLADLGYVTIYSKNWSTRSNMHNGKFLIDGLADGVYNIFAQTDEDSQYANSKTRTITILNGVASDANIELEFTNPMITVTVKNPDGTPATSGYLSISSQTGGISSGGSIYNGKFIIGNLADGVYDIIARANGDTQYTSSKTTTITIVKGVATDANMELKFTNPMITGTVKNPDGTLATSGDVSIFSETGSASAGLYNGKYVIGGLADGVYNMVAYTSGNSEYATSKTTIITIVGGVATDDNIDLVFTTPMVTGTVKNSDGSIASSGYVSMFSQNGGMSSGANIYNGKFLIGGLDDAVYYIVANAYGDSEHTSLKTRTIAIVNGVVSETNIELQYTNPITTV